MIWLGGMGHLLRRVYSLSPRRARGPSARSRRGEAGAVAARSKIGEKKVPAPLRGTGTQGRSIYGQLTRLLRRALGLLNRGDGLLACGGIRLQHDRHLVARLC